MLVIIDGFPFWFGCALFSFFLFFYLLKIFFKILITLFLFILFIFSFFLSFFLPFILSRMDDRVLVLWLGIRPVALRWESQVQDIGPPETSQLQLILNS